MGMVSHNYHSVPYAVVAIGLSLSSTKFLYIYTRESSNTNTIKAPPNIPVHHSVVVLKS